MSALEGRRGSNKNPSSLLYLFFLTSWSIILSNLPNSSHTSNQSDPSHHHPHRQSHRSFPFTLSPFHSFHPFYYPHPSHPSYPDHLSHLSQLYTTPHPSLFSDLSITSSPPVTSTSLPLPAWCCRNVAQFWGFEMYRGGAGRGANKNVAQFKNVALIQLFKRLQRYRVPFSTQKV